MALTSNDFGSPVPASSNDWFEYQHGDVKYRTPTQLSAGQVQTMVDHNITSGLYDEKAAAKQEYFRADLLKNQGLLNAYKTYYKAEHGQDFQGNDEEALDSYYTTMRFMDSNTGYMAATAMKLQGNHYDPNTRLALRDMFSTWDRTASSFSEDAGQFASIRNDPAGFFKNLNLEKSGKALGDTLLAQATDPLNLLLLPFMGVAAKSLTGQAAKVALREIIQKEGMSAVMGAAKAGGLENALGMFVQSGAEQGADIALGLKDDFSMLEQGLNTAIGGVAGAVGAGAIKGATMASGAEALMNKIGQNISAGPGGAAATPTLTQTAQAKARFNDRSKKRNALMDAETAYRTAVANNTDTGAARKTFRDAQAAHFATMLGDFSDNAYMDVSFKTDKSGSTPISKLISGDDLVNFMDKVGVSPEDDFNATFSKVMSFDPARSMDKEIALPISARTQHQAVLLGMTNSAFDRLQASKLVGAGSDDIIMLGENWIKGVRQVTQMQSEGGWALRLAQQRTWMDYDATDWAALSPMDKLNMIDKIRSQKNQNASIGALNTLKGLMNNSKLNGKIIDVTKGINSAFSLNLLSNIDTTIRNTISGVKYGTDMIDQYVGAVYRGDAWTKEFTKSQAALTMDMDNFGSIMHETLQTFLTSKSRMTATEYGESTKSIKAGELNLSSLAELADSMKKGDADWATLSEDQKIGRVAGHLGAALLKSVGERTMLTSDEFIAQLSTRTHLQSTLYMDAIEKGMSKAHAREWAVKKGNQLLKEHITQNISSGSKPGGWGARGTVPQNVQESINYALGTKFQSQMQSGGDIGQIGLWVNKRKNPEYKASDSGLLTVGKAAESVVATHLMPFVRTPASIINYNLEHTPGMSYLSKAFRTTMESGTEFEKSKAAGSVIMGAGMWAAAMNMAVQGQLSGGGPSDYNQAAIARGGNTEGGKRNSGYGFTFNGTKYGLKPFEPFFLPMKVMGDVADIFKYAGPEAGQNASAGIIMAYARQFADYPGLSGITDAAKTVSSLSGNMNERWRTTMSKKLAKEIFSNVPLVGLMANFPQETHREAADFIDEFKKNIPFFNQEMSYTRDAISGQIVKYPHSAVLHVLPFGDQPKQAADIVNQELTSSRLNLPAISSMFGANTERSGAVDLKDYKGVNGRPMYDRLQEIVGQTRMVGGEFGGLNLYESLNKLITSDEYINNTVENKWYPPLSDGTQVAAPQTSAKEAALRFVIQDFRNKALQDFEMELKAEAAKGNEEAKRLISDMTIKKENIGTWAILGGLGK